MADPSSFNPTETILGVVTVIILVGLLIRGEHVATRRREERAAALALFAERFFLRPAAHDGDALAGVYEGESLWMGVQMQDTGGRREQALFTVRMDVGGPLPRDFVAVPRPWTRFVQRLELPGLFRVREPVLDERYVFQSATASEGQALMADARVREALARLGDERVRGFIEKEQVGVAYTRQLPDEATLRAHLEALRAVVAALREASRAAA